MSAELHRESQALSGRAEVLMRDGKMAEARALYRQAAGMEARVFDGIPASRPRTRGIIAVSAVSCLWKAAELSGAIQLAHRYLAPGDLPEFARDQLFELLLECERGRQAQAAERVLSAQTMSVSLRGPGVQLGLAPVDIVVQKLQQLERLVIRACEWGAHAPFREQGPVPSYITQGYRTMVTEAVAGSYSFELRLDRTLQPPLPGLALGPEPDAVLSQCLEIVHTVAEDSDDDVRALLQNSSYRDLFSKMVRNLVPDGNQLSEVAIRGTRALRRTWTILVPSMRNRIDRQIRSEMATDRPEEVKRGVLRGALLNKGMIVLGTPPNEQRCYVGKYKVVDDVVGPLMNHPVRVPGSYGRRGPYQVFYLYDIQPDDESEGQDALREPPSTEGPPPSALTERLL